MWYRLHFTDASLAKLEAMGLNQDEVKTAVNAGLKLQLAENRLVVRHKGLEVEVAVEGPDYHVLDLRAEAPWPRRPSEHPYLQRTGGKA